jgi:lysophospholipase L1-like esterase
MTMMNKIVSIFKTGANAWIVLFVLTTCLVAASVTARHNMPEERANNMFLQDSTTINQPFIIDSLCTIIDSTNSLLPLFGKLSNLTAGDDTVISIIHLGDSHIEAGYLSGRVMRLLQGTFGNAGRGWIAPFKLAGLNEPNDYAIESNIKNWNAGICSRIKPKYHWGTGGIGIETDKKELEFALKILPKNGAGYDFNKALIFRDIQSLPMLPQADDITISYSNDSLSGILVDTFQTVNLSDTLRLKACRENQIPDSSRYYGFELMNGFPGILYHSIGVNGAKFVDYSNEQYVRQLSLLGPSLLIVSLGTNESYGRNYKISEFERQLSELITIIRKELPETTLLLTTPAESFKRVRQNKKTYYVRNENIAKSAEVIKSYAQKEGIACWDLFEISGGKGSCQKWQKAGLFGRDRIHFTQGGYDLQGKLLYKSLIRSFNNEQNLKENDPDVEQY